MLIAATMLTPIAPAAAQASGERILIAQRDDRGPRGPEVRRGGYRDGEARPQRQPRSEMRAERRGEQRQQWQGRSDQQRQHWQQQREARQAERNRGNAYDRNRDG
ncbi:MAG: hypothetical protein ACOY4C_03445, partial [Pseudomonadota bacterium]